MPIEMAAKTSANVAINALSEYLVLEEEKELMFVFFLSLYNAVVRSDDDRSIDRFSIFFFWKAVSFVPQMTKKNDQPQQFFVRKSVCFGSTAGRSLSSPLRILA